MNQEEILIKLAKKEISRVEAEKHDLPSEIFDLRGLVERAARDAA